LIFRLLAVRVVGKLVALDERHGAR
jgi:hypothetical protein